jgi:hypothetical protein
MTKATKTDGQVLGEFFPPGQVSDDTLDGMAEVVVANASARIRAETVLQIVSDANLLLSDRQCLAIRARATAPPGFKCVPVSVANFAAWLIKEARENICGFDGGELQDQMVSDGVLVEFGATAPCGEECSCAQFGFPQQCYRLSDAVKALLKEVAP